MALYYTINFRGSILTSNFNVPMHVRLVSGFSGGDEAMIAKSIAEGMAARWEEVVKPVVSTACNLVRTVVQAYQSETGFYEYAHSVIGAVDVDDLPAYVAFGFRQNRTNVLFRASKHAVPGCGELNNFEGVFAYGGPVTALAMETVSKMFTDEQELTDLASVTGIVKPVLIRTQNTTTDPITHTKTTEFFDPHQISDIGGGTFYGFTSQVSRKRILTSP